MFGIPIHIDTSWFVIVTFLAWSLAGGYFPSAYPGLRPPVYLVMGVVAALLLFGCVLVHELGHSLIARRHGIPVACVTLFLFGGVAQIVRNPQRPSVELNVALAGPLVSALIAGLCVGLARIMPVHGRVELVAFAIVRYLAVINLGLLAFNLLPGFPLDGGRVLRALLWWWSGNLRRATRLASGVGLLLGLGLFALGVFAVIKGLWVGGVWYMLLGWFLRNAALTSYRHASP